MTVSGVYPVALLSRPNALRNVRSTTPDCDFKCLLCAYERIRDLKSLRKYEYLSVYPT